jgi:hypothetical protein
MQKSIGEIIGGVDHETTQLVQHPGCLSFHQCGDGVAPGLSAPPALLNVYLGEAL